MNYLQLTQRLARECGVPGSGPTTVVSQTAELGRLCNWINAAWTEIQTRHEDWDFMRASFSFVTISHQGTYTAAQAGVTDLGVWDRSTFRIYTTSLAYADEMIMDYMDYDTWRNLYLYGNMRTNYSRPVVFTITPNRSLGLGNSPDSALYTVLGDYFTAPVSLAANSDTPTLPTQYHMAIVYRAMMMYGGFESAPEVLMRGEAEFNKLMARMEAQQLGNASFVYGPPLA